jgi:hypothetical protein
MELIKHYIEIIKNIDIHRLNDEELEIILKDFAERYQALQLPQTGVVRSCSHNCTTNYCNSDGSYSHKMCDDCGDVIWD